MPQIWLTYDELGEFRGCSPQEARLEAVVQQWPRRRSRDGPTRIKVPDALMRTVIARMAAQWRDDSPRNGADPNDRRTLSRQRSRSMRRPRKKTRANGSIR